MSERKSLCVRKRERDCVIESCLNISTGFRHCVTEDLPSPANWLKYHSPISHPFSHPLTPSATFNIFLHCHDSGCGMGGRGMKRSQWGHSQRARKMIGCLRWDIIYWYCEEHSSILHTHTHTHTPNMFPLLTPTPLPFLSLRFGGTPHPPTSLPPLTMMERSRFGTHVLPYRLDPYKYVHWLVACNSCYEDFFIFFNLLLHGFFISYKIHGHFLISLHFLI